MRFKYRVINIFQLSGIYTIKLQFREENTNTDISEFFSSVYSPNLPSKTFVSMQTCVIPSETLHFHYI